MSKIKIQINKIYTYKNKYNNGFIEGNIIYAINNNEVDKNFHITPKTDDLYSMVRLEDINELRKITKLKRIKILSQDGASDYIRPVINKMDAETFDVYIKSLSSTPSATSYPI